MLGREVANVGGVERADDEFFGARRSWMSGPLFEAHLGGSSPGALEHELRQCEGIEARAPMEGLEERGARWIATPPGLEHRVGFHFRSASQTLSFPPLQVARVCRLPEAEANALLPGGRAPTPQARAFLVWLVGLVQQLATRTTIESAVLIDEGAAGPTCTRGAGWAYVYEWAEVGEKTEDPRFRRVPLARR